MLIHIEKCFSKIREKKVENNNEIFTKKKNKKRRATHKVNTFGRHKTAAAVII